MTCRRRPVLDGLVLGGIVVDATTPEELVANTAHVIVDMTRKLPPS